MDYYSNRYFTGNSIIKLCTWITIPISRIILGYSFLFFLFFIFIDEFKVEDDSSGLLTWFSWQDDALFYIVLSWILIILTAVRFFVVCVVKCPVILMEEWGVRFEKYKTQIENKEIDCTDKEQENEVKDLLNQDPHQLSWDQFKQIASFVSENKHYKVNITRIDILTSDLSYLFSNYYFMYM